MATVEEPSISQEPVPQGDVTTVPVVSTAPPEPKMSRHAPEASTSRYLQDDEDEVPQGSKFQTWRDKLNPRMVLENSGSVARDHLANERTWLAYVRTSLTIASTGVALVQLFTISAQQVNDPILLSGKLQRFARPLGAVIVVIGLVVLALGVNRYFRIQHALTVNQFPPARKTVAFISTVLAAIVAIVFGVLVGIPRRQ
ncbi:hypothetical protein RhiJN_05567 [Ceratobasidium sp. AG-Ba]|nr:hypothetical protein RhiJN_05567 [Ceratobasidium sp. AG-Ba]QRW06499.1 hypothetical protein RhiLY_05498 [Ceratobasidium sp. AG-Ba]